MKIVFLSLSSLLFSLCIYKAKHNDLNYVHSTLIKEGKGEEEKEEAFICRSRRRSKSVIQIETAKWKSERASNNNNNNNNNNNSSYHLFLPSNGN